MEMRDDIRGLRPVVDAVSCDQALSVERRVAVQRVADTLTAQCTWNLARPEGFEPPTY